MGRDGGRREGWREKRKAGRNLRPLRRHREGGGMVAGWWPAAEGEASRGWRVRMTTLRTRPTPPCDAPTSSRRRAPSPRGLAPPPSRPGPRGLGGARRPALRSRGPGGGLRRRPLHAREGRRGAAGQGRFPPGARAPRLPSPSPMSGGGACNTRSSSGNGSSGRSSSGP